MLSKVLRESWSESQLVMVYDSNATRDWLAVPMPTLRSGHSVFLSLSPLYQSLLSGIILIDVHSFDCIFIYFRALTQNQQ